MITISKAIYKGGKFTHYEIGGIYTNNKGQEYTVIGKGATPYKSGVLPVKVRFNETGYEYEVDPSQITRGTVKDRMAKTVLGVACIGDVVVSGNKRAYNIWHKIIQRCYVADSPRYASYGGKGVTVADRWKCFEYFVRDIPHVDGYDYDKFMDNELQLDKDLKQLHKPHSERVYSLETCTFLSQKDNQIIINYDDKKDYFIVKHPDGTSTIENGIKNYCRENNFTYNLVRQVMNGKAKHHKNHRFYRVPKENQTLEGMNAVLEEIQTEDLK